VLLDVMKAPRAPMTLAMPAYASGGEASADARLPARRRSGGAERATQNVNGFA
jgi:hypothetical protein